MAQARVRAILEIVSELLQHTRQGLDVDLNNIKKAVRSCAYHVSTPALQRPWLHLHFQCLAGSEILNRTPDC